MKNFVNNVRSEISWCKFWLVNSGIKNVKRIKLKILSAAVVF